MKTAMMADALRQKVIDELGDAPLFAGLDPSQISQVVAHSSGDGGAAGQSL